MTLETYTPNGAVLRAMADDIKQRMRIVGEAKRLIYISRQGGVRRLHNAEVIEPILEGFGFETVFLERLSIPEQIQIMAEAKVIFSLHGAGLSNVIFAPPACHVIELSDSRIYDVYGPISRSVGHEYHRLQAAELINRGRNEFNLKDMICDAHELKALLKHIAD